MPSDLYVQSHNSAQVITVDGINLLSQRAKERLSLGLGGIVTGEFFQDLETSRNPECDGDCEPSVLDPACNVDTTYISYRPVVSPLPSDRVAREEFFVEGPES